MICLSCKRPIDKLFEAYVQERGLEVTIIGCQDCIAIAMERFKLIENSRNN